MCGRPLQCKEKVAQLAIWSGAVMCPASSVAALMTAGHDEIRGSGPNQAKRPPGNPGRFNLPGALNLMPYDLYRDYRSAIALMSQTRNRFGRPASDSVPRFP